MKDTKQLLPVRLPQELYLSLRAYSSVMGSSMNEIATEAVGDYLKEHLGSSGFKNAHRRFESLLNTDHVRNV